MILTERKEAMGRENQKVQACKQDPLFERGNLKPCPKAQPCFQKEDNCPPSSCAGQWYHLFLLPVTQYTCQQGALSHITDAVVSLPFLGPGRGEGTHKQYQCFHYLNKQTKKISQCPILLIKTKYHFISIQLAKIVLLINPV